MIAARVLGCAALLTLAACGIGDAIFLGPGAAGDSFAPGGTGAQGGTGGTGGSAGEASMPPPTDDAAMSDATDASDLDSGHDAGPKRSCTFEPTSSATTLCGTFWSAIPPPLATLFAWPPDPSELGAPVLTANTIPLVANFTDDNGDARIDLCDTPDILVLATEADNSGSLYLLSGDTGALHRKFEARVASMVTPALADLDRDGEIEVVTMSPDQQLLVLDHTGEIEISGDLVQLPDVVPLRCMAVAIADLNNDGDPEIVAGYSVFHSNGQVMIDFSTTIENLGVFEGGCIAPVIGEFHGDSELELIYSAATLRASTSEVLSTHGAIGPAIFAEIDGNARPELVVFDGSGLLVVADTLEPLVSPDVCTSQAPPAAVDIDDDGLFELALGGCDLRLNRIFGQNAGQLWKGADFSGDGLVAAFNLSGDFTPEIIHVTRSGFWVHDPDNGDVLISLPSVRAADIAFGGPIVADVNDDGSADVLLISEGDQGTQLVVLGGATGDFPPTRRFYNQYAYQPTHFDERGMTMAFPLLFPVSHQNPTIDDGNRLCLP